MRWCEKSNHSVREILLLLIVSSFLIILTDSRPEHQYITGDVSDILNDPAQAQSTTTDDDHISITTLLKQSLQTGESLINKTLHDLQDLTFPVSVSTGVENYSKWTLFPSAVEIVSGRMNVAPRNIASTTEEGFATHSQMLGATGSWVRTGFSLTPTATIQIMYSAPFDFNLYDNWLSLAVCVTSDIRCAELTASKMYWKKYPFMRSKRFLRNVIPVGICDEDLVERGSGLCVLAWMSTNHHIEVHVNVYPSQYRDLDETVRGRVSNQTLAQKEYEKFIKTQFHSNIFE